MSVTDDIRCKITDGLSPVSLEITDESHLHAGHMEAAGQGETHFRLAIVADAFAGLSRVDAQRLVYQLLADELAGPVHALAISARAP